tara:strand:- start:1419 stop:5849 length:4431 start_codon:yes stop_codon:yes gene_type:complete
MALTEINLGTFSDEGPNYFVDIGTFDFSTDEENIRQAVQGILRQLFKIVVSDNYEEQIRIFEILTSRQFPDGVKFLRSLITDQLAFQSTIDIKNYSFKATIITNTAFIGRSERVATVDGSDTLLQLELLGDDIRDVTPRNLRSALITVAALSPIENPLNLPMLRLINDLYSYDEFVNQINISVKEFLTAGQFIPGQDGQVAYKLKGPAGADGRALLELFPNDFGKAELLPNEGFLPEVQAFGEAFGSVVSEQIDIEFYRGATEQFVQWMGWTNPEVLSTATKSRIGYANFINLVIQDDLDVSLGQENNSTLKEKFDQAVESIVIGASGLSTVYADEEGLVDYNNAGIYHFLMVFLENKRRQAIIDNYDATENQALDQAGRDELVDQIEQNLTNELAGSEAFEEEEEPELTEEDVKNRQRFFKQCALMMNLPTLSEAFTEIIKERVETKINNRQNFTGPVNNTCNTLTEQFNNMPFDGRLFMVSNTDDQSATLSKMLNSDVAKELFNIPPAVLSSLVPKIKLYRVENTDEGIKKTEFVFDSSEDLNRERNFTKATNFFDMPFDKGSGVGLKDFTFEFNGTNPAESRKDIKASLSLHFQSFDDFVAERKSYNNKTYRFVDLILHPPKDEQDILHPDQYSPSYYRVMAEVGYHIPSKEELQAMFPWYQNTTALVEALERTNKAFYLCMIDHDFNINVDGTVNLTVNYGAYVETILKTHQYDALATPDVVEQRKQNAQQYLEALKSNQCTQDQLQRILATLDAQETVLRERSLKSIIQRLIQRNKIFICEIPTRQASSYRKSGYFKKKPELKGLVSKSKEVTQDDVVKQGQETGVTETILTQVYLPEDYNFNSPNDNTIQYFYFGDLLHTVLDTMYEDGSPSKLREDVENCRFILGSFDFDIYKNASNLDNTVNIAQIPISVEYFADWFQNNVLKKGDTRKSFPIVTFIRNLSSNLLQQSLLESCVNRRIDKNFSFQTGQITAYNKAGNPLRSIFGEQNVNPVIEVDNYRVTGSSSIFPFKGDTTSEVKDISGYHNFMYLGVLGSSLSTKGNGNYAEDNLNGMYHIEIGNNKGIVKSVSFAKTDMQFVREARFFQQGIDGLLQLSTVYKVTIEMFGNTIFYPGMDLFLNPYGIGGDKLGSPTQGGLVAGQKRSLANKLGLGGYHTVTSVRSSIGVNGFKTTIEAQMYYAGDGSKTKLGSNPNNRLQKISQTQAPAKTNNNNSCKAIVKRVESNLSRIEKGLPTFGISRISNVNQTATNVQNNATNSTPATSQPVSGSAGNTVVPNAQAAAQQQQQQNQAVSASPGGTAGTSTSQDELDELDAMLAEMEASGTSTQSTPPAPTTTPETPTTTPAGDEQTTTPPASGTQPTEAPAEETPAETPEPEAAAEENLQVPISDQEQAEAALFDELLPIAKEYEPKPNEDPFDQMTRLAGLNNRYNILGLEYNKSVLRQVNGVEVQFAEITITYTDGRPAVYARKRK